jgi:hypothetical protein
MSRGGAYPIVPFRLWNWLDEMQSRRLLVRFDQGRPQFVLAAISQVMALFYYRVSILQAAPVASSSLVDVRLTVGLASAVLCRDAGSELCLP